MENQHPVPDELYSYIDAPEASKHSAIRYHLMNCAHCRTQVDKLNQLELHIKHYLPRTATDHPLREDKLLDIEQFVEQKRSGTSNQAMEDKIKSDAVALKAALHYAVHSNAMNRNSEISMQPMQSPNITGNSVPTNSRPGIRTGIYSGIRDYLQWPLPAWALAPASFAIAALISVMLITQTDSRQLTNRIASYQDDATITFTKSNLPDGSIGFFHDAQSRSQAFSGIHIETSQQNRNGSASAAQDLKIHWPAVSNAKNYQINIYYYQDNDKRLLAQQSSQQPAVIIENVKLNNGQHYQWDLSGTTDNGFKFRTSGDFVYIGSSSE